MNLRILNSRITGLTNLFKKLKVPVKILFITTGALSTLWFLIRVIPKPSRAGYPCMQATAPWASAFVIYLIGLTGSVLALRRSKSLFQNAKYFLAAGSLLIGLVLAFSTLGTSNNKAYSITEGVALEEANSPMGTAKGMFPGRVVWVHNPDATNEKCTNNFGDGYFLDKNTNQDEVDKMLESAIYTLTETSPMKDAWDALFKYHNKERGKGEVGYKSGEIIFIKINATSTWSANIDGSTYSRKNNNNYAISETSPQLVHSVLRHLVNIVGVPQNQIYVGDPLKFIYQDNFNKWTEEFPNVHYLHNGSDNKGREGVVKSSSAKIDYSDRGTVLRTGDWNDPALGDPVNTDNLYTIFEDMEYMINLPNLKGHERAGVTMFAKNHFGSHTRGDAKHLHMGLVQQKNEEDNRNTYGLYRVQVDLLSHELLGKKNLFYLMDALYCSEQEVNKPEKWQIAPFNEDWTSSLFLSQDPIAIESVGFDFLYAQYDGVNNDLPAYPHYGAVDDYLHQAADKANWPEDISYDPENDGSEISTLGVHEHWNNVEDKKYTRNLKSGDGIELLSGLTPPATPPTSIMQTNIATVEFSAYPIPVVDILNIKFANQGSGLTSINLYDLNGKLIYSKSLTNHVDNAIYKLDMNELNQGTYLLLIENENTQQSVKISKR